MKKLALILIYLLVVIFNSSSQIAFSNHPIGEIFRINHDSTEITFAGHKYIKQADIKIKQTGMIQTEYHSDGSIKSVFRKDVNGNIGIGNGGYDVSLHVYSGGGNVGLSNGIPCPSEKLHIKSTGDTLYWKTQHLIFTSDSTIYVEDKLIDNSKKLEKLETIQK